MSYNNNTDSSNIIGTSGAYGTSGTYGTAGTCHIVSNQKHPRCKKRSAKN